MKKILLLASAMLLWMSATFSQNTWTGAVSSDWADAANWSLTTVPTSTTDVIIPPNPTNLPIILNGTDAVAQSVIDSSTLTINSGGTLTVVNGDPILEYGILVEEDNGVLNNSGTIIVSETPLGVIVFNGGTFTQTSGSSLRIFNVGEGIFLSNDIVSKTSSFTNQLNATITIDSFLIDGIATFGTGIKTFTNNGIIALDNSPIGIVDGINIANGVSAGASTFTNTSTGVVEIDSIGFNAIRLSQAGDKTLINDGTITIGEFGRSGIFSTGEGTKAITNNGSISINSKDRGDDGILLSGSNTFINSTNATIVIDSLRENGISLSGSSSTSNILFTNNGDITVKRVENDAINTDGDGTKTITNNGAITINASNEADDGIDLSNSNNPDVCTMTNSSTGVIRVDSVGGDGIVLESRGTKEMINDGLIVIQDVEEFGISLVNSRSSNTATFTNNDSIIINTVRAFDGIFFDGPGAKTFENNSLVRITNTFFDGIFLQTDNLGSTSTFNNNTDGIVTIVNADEDGVDGFTDGGTITYNNSGLTTFINPTVEAINEVEFNNLSGGKLTGAGSILASSFVGTQDTLSPGLSPGFFTYFDTSPSNQDFSSTTFQIEIDGLGTGGIDFDQIRVISTNPGINTAILGGTSKLEVVFTFSPGVGDRFQVFDVDAFNGVFNEITVQSPNEAMVSFDYTTGEVVVDSVVPVELLDFSGYAKDAQVVLEWQTASEINNAGFVVQRSADGKTFKELDFIKGAGTSLEQQAYRFIDGAPMQAINYYRLKQMDFDGAYEYSDVIAVALQKEAALVRLQSNLVQDQLTILVADRAELNIVNTMGISVQQSTIRGNSTIDVSQLVAGTYNLLVTVGGKTEVLRFVKF